MFDKKWERNISIGNPYADTQRLLEWAQIQQIKRKINRSDWAQLLGRKLQLVRGISRPPLYEQIELFERFNGTRVITSQPLKKNENLKDCNHLLNWCRIRGLKISSVNEELSWFKPGKSVLYQIELEDETRYIDYIRGNKKKALYGWIVE
jgi:hypothetical protein